MKQPSKLASSPEKRYRRLHRLTPEEVLIQKESERLGIYKY